MKTFKLTSLAAAVAIAISGSAFAGPAAKFAAHVSQSGSGSHLLHSGVATAVTSGQVVKVDNEDNILSATIKTANQKDLLIGVSLQNGLFTDTTVKGKLGSSEVATAMAAILVRVEIDGQKNRAFPSSVVFAQRIQELSATLGGVIQSCNFGLTDSNGDGVPDSGEIVIARDCTVTEEQIGLMLSTTSANHFNFVAPNLTPGDHTVKVYARAMSSAEFKNGLTPTKFDAAGNPIEFQQTADNSATAWALIDVGSLTVEETRAVNRDSGISVELGTSTTP